MLKGFAIAVIGNPNCGKTTVFNGLTAGRQQVGNWPGVTVDRKSGTYRDGDQTVEVVDLPGTYSLTVAPGMDSIDERIAQRFLIEEEVDVILNVVDAANLERNLYLTAQLLELELPMVVAPTRKCRQLKRLFIPMLLKRQLKLLMFLRRQRLRVEERQRDGCRFACWKTILRQSPWRQMR